MNKRIGKAGLTAAGVGLHVLHAADSGVVAVRDESRHGIQQTIHIARGARVRQVVLQQPQAPPALLIYRLIHPHWFLSPDALLAPS